MTQAGWCRDAESAARIFMDFVIFVVSDKNTEIPKIRNSLIGARLFQRRV